MFFGVIVAISSLIKNEISYEKKNIVEQDSITKKVNYIMEVSNGPQYAKDLRLLNGWDLLERKHKVLFQNMFQIIKKSLHIKLKSRYLIEHITYVLFSFLFITFVWFTYSENKIDSSYVITAFSLVLTMQSVLNEFTESLVLFNINTYGVSKLFDFLKEENNKESYVCKERKSRENYVWKVENLSYCYNNRLDYALKNINFEIMKNEKIAVVGCNGAGKSTLIKCMSGLYKNYSGEIYFNGENVLNQYDKSNICVLFQDAKVYPFTISENVSSNDLNIDIERVEKALKNVGLLEKFINQKIEITEYISKLFSESGIEFSGGENQKILLSRIVYRNPEIIILDEPTSNLDIYSEEKILELIMDLFKDKTIIVVTHKMTILDKFDRILVLENGSLVENGNLNELLKQKNILYMLKSIQEEGSLM